MAINSKPTHYNNGVTNAKITDSLGKMGQLDPTLFHTKMNDFDTVVTSPTTTAVTATAGGWITTIVDTDTDGGATQALQQSDDGRLLITTDNNAADSTFIQAQFETYLMETGKKAWFKTKFQVADATDGLVIGMHILDASPLASAASDGIFFRSADDADTISLVVTKDSTETTLEVATLVDATDITLGWYYNGNDKVEAYVNDAYVGSVATTNLPDDEELAEGFGIKNGTAAAKTLNMDYYIVAKER